VKLAERARVRASGKHGHERARLTPKTQKVSARLQKIPAAIRKRYAVSNVGGLQGRLGAQASLPASSANGYFLFKAPLAARTAGRMPALPGLHFQVELQVR